MEASPTQEVAQSLDDNRRKELLNQRLSGFTSKGYRVESQTDFNAVLVKGHRPNHILHLILSIVTLGLWLFVWLGVALVAGEKRRTLSVDQYGNFTG